jgi:hypothetical protein
VFEAAFKKAEAQSVRSARAVREQITFSQRLERQKVRESKAAVAAAAKVANEEERLRRKYIEGYAAMDVYSKELNDLAVARKADVISAEQQRQAVERLNQQMATGTGVFSAYGAATKGNVKGTNNLGVMMQQTGYQVGDFAVQVQGGTNVAVAFGQQATQLVGALYLLPAPLLAAKVGILGLSISVTALIASFSIILPIVTGVVAYFMRTAEASRNAKEKVNSFEDALSSARTQLQGMKEDLRLLQSGLQSAFVLTLSDEVDKAREALSEAREELNALYTQEFAVGESLANVVNLDDYEESIRLAKDRLLTATIELSTAQELSRQEKQRERDASIANQLYEARVILFEQMVDNQEALKEGAQGFLNIWTAITDQIKESSASMQAAQRAIEVGRVADQYAQYGAGRAAFEGIVQGGLGDTAGGVKPPSTPSSRQQGGAIKESPLERLQKELDLQRELVGQSEAYVKVRQALGDDYAKTSPQVISGLQAQYAETQKLIEIEKQRQSIIDKVGSSMENSFMSMVDGTKSVKDAFKSMAADIIKELYRVLVVQQIVNSAKTAMGGFFADGAAFSGGRVTPFANGGVVGSPTYFPMSGGKTGLMGEAGPEAIMPLKRGSDGKLGVSVEGGSGAVNVTNNINVTGGSDPAAIRMEVAKLMPQITSATKSAVIDARRRGGQMKAAFG